MEKTCLNCNKVFNKKSCDSKKYWLTKKFCSSSCFGKYVVPAKALKGRKRPPDVLEKCLLTAFKKGTAPWNKGKPFLAIRGESHHNWKGGITQENQRIRTSLEMKLWKRAVLERDNFTCVECGIRGVQFDVDHIKPFAIYPELRFAIDNGRTLCKPCHLNTPTWGFRTLYVQKYV